MFSYSLIKMEIQPKNMIITIKKMMINNNQIITETKKNIANYKYIHD